MVDSRAPAAREARRVEIIRASAHVFARKGFEAATISDITEAAGVSRRTFYKYFESKKDLFLQCVELYFTEYSSILTVGHERLKRALESNEMPFDAWRELVLTILRYHKSNRAMTAIAYREAQGQDEHYGERIRELDLLAREKLTEDFRLMLERGLLVPFDLDVVIPMINGAIVTVALDIVLGDRKADLEMLADQIVRFNARALAPVRSVVDEAFAVK